MSWAARLITRLGRGEVVAFRPRGHSMRPRIESGTLCTVAPLDPAHPLEPGDVVLCAVRGIHYLHLIKAIQGERHLIGNNRGGLNGWIGRNHIYGKLISRERP